MNKNFSKKAFSLIELSLVILIIGVLIIAVTQGSRLVAKSKLNIARALTRTSSVNDIDDLILWLESSLEESFLAAERIDNSYVSLWNDINSSTLKKNHFSRVTNDESVTYKESGINNLPSIYFNGASASTDSILQHAAIPAPNNFTFFAVAQCLTPDTANDQVLFYNGHPAFNGFGYLKYNSNNSNRRGMLFGDSAFNRAYSSQSADSEIIMTTTNGANPIMEINGVAQELYSSSPGYYPAEGIASVGNAVSVINAWNGYVSEIILFERNLKDLEKKNVYNYLSKKYNIAINP